jgi:hypothetical protein
MSREQDHVASVGYVTRCERLPAFDLIVFAKIVASGGEQFSEVRGDGWWEMLRGLAGEDGTIYGVASLDGECQPRGHYRYTLAVRTSPGPVDESNLPEGLFAMHIAESEWLVFTIESFGTQYGRFWQDDPYAMLKLLGWEFSNAVGLHIDLFPPTFADGADGTEFMMPVAQLTPTEVAVW